MVLLTDCIACQHGDHDNHREVIHAAPEGMLGGTECPCNGECRDRPTESWGLDPEPDGGA